MPVLGITSLNYGSAEKRSSLFSLGPARSPRSSAAFTARERGLHDMLGAAICPKGSAQEVSPEGQHWGVSMRMNGKVALVTGAGSGIGLATARRLADEGATVVATIFDESQRPAVAGFETLALDARSEPDWDRALGHVESTYGGLDILINNAGLNRRGTAESTSLETWSEVMAVNLTTAFLGCKKAIPLLRRRGGGAIVNLASVAALAGTPNMVAYCAAKGAVRSMTMALAVDHAGENIRVNCVCPGAIDTAMIADILSDATDPEAARAAVARRHPMGRIAKAEEVAAVIAFLASSDASFMTGLAIPVDGGRSVRF